MKKLLLLFLPLLLVLSTVRGQTITQTPGVPHTTGTPTGAPSPLTKASWLRFDKTNKILYRWTGSAWTSTFPGVLAPGSVTNTELASGTGGIYKGSGTVPASTVATATNGFSMNSGASGQILLGDYGSAGLGGNLNLQGSGAILGTPGYQFRAQADDQYTQMVSPGYTVRLEPTTAYTLIQSTATNGYKFWDTRATPRGVEYSADYSATYNTRSLVDKGYVDAAAAAAGDGNGIYDGSGTVPNGTTVTASGFSLRTTSLGRRASIRFDTLVNYATGGGTPSPGGIVMSNGIDNNAYVQVSDADGHLRIGSVTSDPFFGYFTFANGNTFYTDDSEEDFGIRYAADYSSTIAQNARSIPDVGTVKGLEFEVVKITDGSFYSAIQSPGGLVANRDLFLPPVSGEILAAATATATLNFPSTAAGTSSDLTISVTGAADGNPVIPGYPNASTLSNGAFSAWVSAANTVTVRFTNNSSGALDPASGTFRVTVLKY